MVDGSERCGLEVACAFALGWKFFVTIKING